MKLKVKDLDIATGSTMVALLNQKDAKTLDLHANDRILIKYGKRSVVSVVNVAESSKVIKKGKIGLFEEVLDKLKVKKGRKVKIELEMKPNSVSYVLDKLKGEKLSKDKIDVIVRDIVNSRLSNIELSYFVAGCYTNGLDDQETANLTKAIVNNGLKLKFKKPVVDKHCSGGVPGNRTTMLVVPIVAAAGYKMPKTSSRSITSPAGTADTMEVLAKVIFDAKKLKRIVNKIGGCIAWGGAVGLADADDKLIQVRHSLSLDPKGLLLSSILAKKYAVGASHVVIDIPIGNDTKVKTKRKGKALKKDFIKLGKKLGMKIKVYMTNGSQPVGNGIGPALEARDVLMVLENDPLGPMDLRDKSIHLAGDVFRMLGIKNPEKKAEQILESGKAHAKMMEIIKAQGGNHNIKPKDIKIGEFSHDYKAHKSGIIKDVNNFAINKLCRICGCPTNKGAGMYLYKHEKQKVSKGQKLFTLYSESKEKLKFAVEAMKKLKVVVIK